MTEEKAPSSDEEKWQLLARHEKLGEILLKRGMLTLVQLEKVMNIQETTGRAIGEVILEEKLLTREQVMQALEWQQRSDLVEEQAIKDLIDKKK